MHIVRKVTRPSFIVNHQEQAHPAKNKPAAAGQDIDLSRYITPDKELPYQSDPSQLPAPDKEQMLSSGIMLDNLAERAGTFLQIDNTPVHFSAQQEGIEVMATSEAIEKYD